MSKEVNQEERAPRTVEDVKEMLTKHSNGEIQRTIQNCITILQNDHVLADAIRLNLLSERIDIVKPVGWPRSGKTLSDTDMKYILRRMEKYGISSEKKIESAIRIVANENRYHPIRDYLNSLKWVGRYLKEVLAENKVDVSGMAVDADHPTTMAVVSVDATGERDFSFYRSANADVMLSKEDISEGALKAAKIVHFGSVSLTADPSRTATLDAAARAKKMGAVITYDPNYRANLWKNKEEAIAQMKAPLPLVDILKVSDEELPLLTGTTDCESGTAQLAQNGIRLIFVTLGANGVFYRFGDKTGHVAGVPCKVGDTNGAGDTFFGAALSKLCKEELDTLTVDKLESILAFANKAASITTSRHGAIPAMPTLAEVEG